MKAKTHMAGGMALAASATAFLGLYSPNNVQGMATWGIFFLAPAIAGSLAPDIDHGNSKASNVNIFTKLLSIFLRVVCGHRGAIHSPFVMILSGGIGYMLLSHLGVSQAEQLSVGFMIGYLSHLIIDATNKAGIPVFYPIIWDENGKPKKFHILGLPEGGLCEFIMWAALIGISVWCGYLILT